MRRHHPFFLLRRYFLLQPPVSPEVVFLEERLSANPDHQACKGGEADSKAEVNDDRHWAGDEIRKFHC